MALLPVGWMAGILAVFTAGVCYLRKKCGRSLIWWLLPLFALWGMGWCKGDLQKDGEYKRTVKALLGRSLEMEGTLKGIQEKKGKDGLVLEMANVTIWEDGREHEYGGLLTYLDGECLGVIEEDLHIGERLRVRGTLERFDGAKNPGEFDLEKYYHAIGIEGRFFGEGLTSLDQGYSPYFDGICRARRRVGTVLDQICTQEDRGIFHAVVLGEKTELSADIKKLYQSSGISHLLAVSGLHISMIGMGCYRLLRKMGLGFKGAGAAGMAVTVSYGILAGGIGISASVNRAVLMVVMQMLADCLGRTYDMRTGISVSGILLLLRSPTLLFQAGFQLSFGAVMVLGIAVPVAERWLGTHKGWQKTLLAGAAVQLGTFPVIAYHYFEYPVYGILLNLAVIPLMSYVLMSGILGVVLGCAGVKAAEAAVGTGHYVLKFYQWLCETVQKLPGAVIVTGRPAMWQIGLYGILWCVLLAVMAAKDGGDHGEEEGGKGDITRMRWTRAAGIGKWAGVSLAILLIRFPVKGMEVTFLDVGQGDGICFRTEDAVVLVDGGSTDRKMLGTQVLEPFLKSQGITKVDYAIVSHGDEDHISGLMELLNEDWGIGVRHVILPWLGKGGGDDAYGKLERAARGHGAFVAWMKRGDRIVEGRLEIACLYAGEEEDGGKTQDRNQHSLMLHVKYGLAGVLLTGDMSEEGEEKWLDMGDTPKVQVLKAAHHGSSHSTGEAFLKRIHPCWAVVSCGEGNRYGHPGGDTMERLKKQGIKGLVTMDTGAVTVKTNGIRMEIKTFIPGGDSS